MVRKLSFVLVFLSLASCFAFAQENSSIVPGRYLIKFKNTLDLGKIKGHKSVVESLREQLEQNIDLSDKHWVGKDIERLWICNSVGVSLSRVQAEKISKSENIVEIRPVRYKRWIEKDIDKKKVKYDTTKPQWGVAIVKAPEAWEKFKIDGTGVVVGHLDTGIAADHPLLKGKTLAFKDYSKEPQDSAYDDQGHGTHTAGSICGDSGVGVAPGAKLIVAKVFDKSGYGEDESILKAMQWVMDPDGNPETNDGPMLVSNSWGDDDSTDTFMWDAVSAWVAAGIVPVFAAGNSGPWGKVGSPGSFPHSWAVAATNSRDSLAYFSSQGPVVWNGETLVKPDIAAPGLSVVSCSTSGGLVSNSGTSMACPHAAGLVALMLQANPKLTIDEVRTIAEETAKDLGEPGKDTKYGSGRFNALACLEKVMAGSTPEALFHAYEAALSAEKALIGVQAETPLSGPLATSIVKRVSALDEGEFSGLQKEITGTCGEPGKALLKDAAQYRAVEKQQK